MKRYIPIIKEDKVADEKKNSSQMQVYRDEISKLEAMNKQFTVELKYASTDINDDGSNDKRDLQQKIQQNNDAIKNVRDQIEKLKTEK